MMMMMMMMVMSRAKEGGMPSREKTVQENIKVLIYNDRNFLFTCTHLISAVLEVYTTYLGTEPESPNFRFRELMKQFFFYKFAKSEQ